MRKTCGKPVQILRMMWVRTHFVYTNLRNELLYHASKHTGYTHHPQISSLALPTRNMRKITEVSHYFSPLSTALIITTTKYIYSKGLIG